MARHTGLREAENARQLAHVEAILGEHAQQAQAGRVGEESEQWSRRRI